MNWLDIALVVVLGWFAFSGLMTGLIREIFSLGGFLLGIILAAQYHQQLAATPIMKLIENPEVARVVAFIAIFLGVGLAAHFVAYLFDQILSFLFLGWANHLGGAAFGLLKGAIILEVALQVAPRLPFLSLGTTVAESGVAQVLIGLVPGLWGRLPFAVDPAHWFLP